jgi:hypothetical protein
MENKSDKRVQVSRPKDRSLEAYKLWMMDIYKQITTKKSKIKLTEEDWIANWKEYWEEKSKD